MAKKETKNKTPSKKHEQYEVAGEELKRKQAFCPKCGPGTFMAKHADRLNCGTCGYMEKLSS